MTCYWSIHLRSSYTFLQWRERPFGDHCFRCAAAVVRLWNRFPAPLMTAERRPKLKPVSSQRKPTFQKSPVPVFINAKDPSGMPARWTGYRTSAVTLPRLDYCHSLIDGLLLSTTQPLQHVSCLAKQRIVYKLSRHVLYPHWQSVGRLCLLQRADTDSDHRCLETAYLYTAKDSYKVRWAGFLLYCSSC